MRRPSPRGRAVLLRAVQDPSHFVLATTGLALAAALIAWSDGRVDADAQALADGPTLRIGEFSVRLQPAG